MWMCWSLQSTLVMINHPYEVSKASVRTNVVLTHCPGASSCKEEIANHELNYDISFKW